MENGTSPTEDSYAGYLVMLKEAINKLEDNLETYAAPTITLVATTGTTFVLYCLLTAGREKFKGKHAFILALTLADFFTILFSVFVTDFLLNALGSRLPMLEMPHVHHSWVCKLWSFGWILSNSLSANLLCLLAADRIYALCWPLHHRVHMTRTRYYIAVAAFVLTFAVISLHGVATYDVMEYYGYSYCYLSPDIGPGVRLAAQLYTNLTMNGLLPGLALSASNLVLCHRLARIRAERLTSGLAADGSANSGTAAASPSLAEIRSSLTLVIMAFAYLAASVPRAVCYFVSFLLNRRFVQVASQADLLPMLFSLAKCLDYLFYANCSINWIIYCTRVPLFRNRLGQFSACCKQQ